MQLALEGVVEKIQEEEKLCSTGMKTVMVQIPEVQDVIGSRGYNRFESVTSHGNGDRVHPLHKHLGCDNTITSLGMHDILCDDGFHPGKLGTVYIGSLIADAYIEQCIGGKRHVLLLHILNYCC